MKYFSTRINPGWCAALVIGLLGNMTAVASSDKSGEWKFKVFLDEDSIGYHHFSLDHSGDRARLVTRADFQVTFLKIPLYSYEHENTEHWKSRCLERIESTTDQNGELYTVKGMRTDNGFQIESREGDNILPDCISTFAYWDVDFLQRKQLLNSQTGEYVDVSTDYLGESHIETGDINIPARHYRLTAKDLVIDLWYSHSDRWLALETPTSTGSVLRYVTEQAQ